MRTPPTVERIAPLLEKVATERRKRVTTSEMNRFIEQVDSERASVPMRQLVKILYMAQASVAPPTFVLFTNRAVKLHFSISASWKTRSAKPSVLLARPSGSRTEPEIPKSEQAPCADSRLGCPGDGEGERPVLLSLPRHERNLHPCSRPSSL